MLGGPPGWPAPVYAQPMFVSQPSPQWQRRPAPAAAQASSPQQRTPRTPTPAPVQQPRTEPLARAQMEDPAPVPITPRRTALCLPAPENLGVAAPGTPNTIAAAPLDW